MAYLRQRYSLTLAHLQEQGVSSVTALRAEPERPRLKLSMKDGLLWGVHGESSL